MTFSGLFISTSGMMAAQVGLDITSNNIANANNDGYTRKTINFQESTITSANTTSKIKSFSSVVIDEIQRVRDYFLDQQLRRQNSAVGKDGVVADFTIQLNRILGEPSETGLTAKLNDFFKAASDLSANPELETAKTVFVNSAVALTDSFQKIDQSIAVIEENLTVDLVGELPVAVNNLNEKLTALASVHNRVVIAQRSEEPISELEDARDLLLDEISTLLNVKINKTVDGQISGLSMQVNPSEALIEGTVSFPNITSPIAGLTLGNNSLTLSVDNGNGSATGPFTVNFEANSSIKEVVEKINSTFKAAGGKGSIATVNPEGQLVIQSSMIENAVNSSSASVVISAGSANSALGLTAGTVTGSSAFYEDLVTTQGCLYKFVLENGEKSAGVYPSKLKMVSNDFHETDLGYIENTSGKIGGYLEMSNKEIPEMRALLSDFAMNIKEAVNKLSVLGKTANGNPGAELFVGTSAGDFAVNANILENNALFTTGKTGAASDGTIISEISDLFFGTSALISDGSQSEKVYLDSSSGAYSNSSIPVIPGENIKINVKGIIKNNGSDMNAGTNGVANSSSLVQIEFLNANGVVIGSAIDFPASQGAPSDQVNYTGTIPANSAFVRLKMNTSVDPNLEDNFGHFGISIVQGEENNAANNFNNKMSQIIGDFGTRGNVALARQTNSDSLLTSLETRRQSMSGVSIEEEAANLIRFQNSFAANARVISVWDNIFQSIISMI
jgi:flagellar hook-associated protein FlgK